jgi:hypothetical protein
MCHHLVIIIMHKLSPFYPIYKLLSSVIGLNRSFMIFAAKTNHWNERSGQHRENIKIMNFCSNCLLASATLHARAVARVSDCSCFSTCIRKKPKLHSIISWARKRVTEAIIYENWVPRREESKNDITLTSTCTARSKPV